MYRLARYRWPLFVIQSRVDITLSLTHRTVDFVNKRTTLCFPASSHPSDFVQIWRKPVMDWLPAQLLWLLYLVAALNAFTTSSLPSIVPNRLSACWSSSP